MYFKWAYVFGAVLVVLGVLGFVPGVNVDGKLFGVFAVDTHHNLVHLITGLAGLVAGYLGELWSKRFFQVFGVIYAIVALLGFYYGNAPILGLMANNMADNLLHIVIAATALWIGFGKCKGCCSCDDDRDNKYDK